MSATKASGNFAAMTAAGTAKQTNSTQSVFPSALNLINYFCFNESMFNQSSSSTFSGNAEPVLSTNSLSSSLQSQLQTPLTQSSQRVAAVSADPLADNTLATANNLGALNGLKKSLRGISQYSFVRVSIHERHS